MPYPINYIMQDVDDCYKALREGITNDDAVTLAAATKLFRSVCDLVEAIVHRPPSDVQATLDHLKERGDKAIKEATQLRSALKTIGEAVQNVPGGSIK